jgi:hypothetical protein
MLVQEEDLKRSYKGKLFTVIHCDKAITSFKEELSHVPQHKHKAYIRNMIHQIKRLADGHKMSSDNFPKEGLLPSLTGKRNSKSFNALKRKPLRGYCWRSDKKINTYFISHYAYKDYQKLKKKDEYRVCENWKRIEVNGYEY